jgi:hypothetical protein
MLRPRGDLASRTTRIRLLAWSYLDAVEAGGGGAEENVSTGGTESRAPSRNHELWHQGSYGALEKAVDSLPPFAAIRFWVFYIRAKGPFRHEHKPHPVLGRVERLMPREVFVPAEISEAAGFLPAEAKTYSR